MRLSAWADLYSRVGMLELFNVPKESWEPVLSFAIMVIHPRHSLKHQVVLCRKGSHIWLTAQSAGWQLLFLNSVAREKDRIAQ